MSQYTYIFLHKGQEYLEVSCTGRSAALSEMFSEYAPWEKIHYMPVEELTEVYRTYRGELNKWKEYIQKKEAEKALIATFNNTAEDKMELIYDCNESIAEVTETIEELTEALAQVAMLISIADSSDNGVSVFVGCECGSEVNDTYRDDYVELNLRPVDPEDYNMFDGDQK